MQLMNMKQWIVAFSALFLMLGTACKDELTLDEAGDAVFLTITPKDPTIYYGGDTLTMSCEVISHSGKPVTDAVVEWVSDDPSVARFVEGTNRLVAEHGGIGRETKVRAKLSNGKYALTNVTVSRTKVASLELVTYKISSSDDKKKVKNPETGKEEEVVVGKKYSATTAYLGENPVIALGGSIEIVVRSVPESLLHADEFQVLGVDPALCEVTQLELHPELDKDKIAVTPRGAVWYRIRSTGARGVANLTFRVLDQEAVVAIDFGTKLEKIGFNKNMDEVASSEVLDINQEKDVKIYAEIMPATDEDLEVIKRSIKWSVTDTRGGSGRIVGLPTVEREGQGIVFKTKVRAGGEDGAFTLRCELQGKELTRSYTVVNKAMVAFEKIVFEGAGFDDLYAGETKQLRIRILPKTSFAILHPEVQISYSVPDIAEATYNDGLYSVSGKKAGNTELIARLRGREYRLPITVKPAPRSVLIDSRTPNVLMLGDEVAWTADVQMEGGDAPVWANLKWSIADIKYAKFVGAASGQRVRIKAAELTEGDGVLVKADYRGKVNERALKVVPVQPNVVLSDANIKSDDAGVTTTGGAVKLELTSKSAEAQPSINIYLRAKQGAAALEAKTYSGSNYDIDVEWAGLNLRKAAASSSTVTLTEVGGKWSAVVNITLTVGDKTITVTGTVTGLEKF